MRKRAFFPLNETFRIFMLWHNFFKNKKYICCLKFIIRLGPDWRENISCCGFDWVQLLASCKFAFARVTIGKANIFSTIFTQGKKVNWNLQTWRLAYQQRMNEWIKSKNSNKQTNKKKKQTITTQWKQKENAKRFLEKKIPFRPGLTLPMLKGQ